MGEANSLKAGHTQKWVDNMSSALYYNKWLFVCVFQNHWYFCQSGFLSGCFKIIGIFVKVAFCPGVPKSLIFFVYVAFCQHTIQTPWHVPVSLSTGLPPDTLCGHRDRFLAQYKKWVHSIISGQILIYMTLYGLFW